MLTLPKTADATLRPTACNTPGAPSMLASISFLPAAELLRPLPFRPDTVGRKLGPASWRRTRRPHNVFLQPSKPAVPVILASNPLLPEHVAIW